MPDKLPEEQKPQPFTTRPVEQPVFSTDMRAQMRPTVNSNRSFFQSNKYYLIGGILGLVVIALLSFFAFRKQPAVVQQAANVDVKINAPDTVASGGDEVYKIEITNHDNQKLVNIQLELVYADGQTYDSSVPPATNLSGTLFPVGDLGQGTSPAIIVKTKVTGNVNDSKQITARLHYQYANFNSQFIKEQTFAVRLSAAGIALDLDGPNNANNGQLVIYTINYQNNADNTAPNARINMQYPEGFSFASSDPSPSLGNNIWDIGSLQKTASGTIQVVGTFNSAAPGSSLTAIADFLIMGTDGNYFTQNSAQSITAISDQPLLATQTVSAGSTIVNPGDSLTYSIKYQNNATVAANAVNVVAVLDSAVFDLSTIQAQGGQVNNDNITWNASSAQQLQLVAPNQSGTLQFTVRLKNPATKDSSTNLIALTHVKIGSNEYSTFYPGSDLSLKISSPSSITAVASFVSGSNPPKVGTNSTYSVTLTLRNSTNNFSNTSVNAFIPVSGGFSQSSINAAEQKNVTYDASTGKLTWNVGALPAHSGQFTAARTLTFNINLNPSSNQVGQSPTLLKTIALDATDSFTQALIHNTANDLNTSSASGSGYGGGAVTQ